MKEGLSGRKLIAEDQPVEGGRVKRRTALHCSICSRRIWFSPFHLMEPEGVPEPPRSWVLCKGCYTSLQGELRRSPVLSPLRLRVAIGLVAAERWPLAYPDRIKSYLYDRRWVVAIAIGSFIAILLHLVIIVIVATLYSYGG
ncbi:MAG: hypothetical protein IMW89_07785 [Ktedonobacteraceae bacterium]|nr:hypothetical protein [Ktedonobacteraceae bacterium]